MNNRPSSIRVFGSSLVANPYTPQFTPYVYGGDQPFATDGAATSEVGRLCADPVCARDDIKAKGLCKLHYERARTRKARARKEAAA